MPYSEFNFIIYYSIMVKKMKLKWLFLALGCLAASQVQAADAGLRFIQASGVVKCGTNLMTDAYARKDENGQWQGIDADMCRVFALAAFGRSNAFELMHIEPQQANSALATNKIDIMLGNTPFSASSDIAGLARPAEVMYYDRQVFMVRDGQKAKSMDDFKGQNLCAVSNSDDLFNLQLFMEEYKINFNILYFNSFEAAKNAFLLNRCNLMTGNETMLLALVKSLNKPNITLLPEVLSYKPIYAVVARDNVSLQVSIKWIMNALALSEEHGITGQNVDIFLATKNKSLRNLLGIDPELWKKFSINPEWLKTALKELGNYGAIYERNLGNESTFQFKRGKNRLISNGGLIRSQSFL